MKITYKIVTPMGSLEHSFRDEKLVEGFQELEDMLGDGPEATPRMVLLKHYMDTNGLWGKTYDNFFITNIERTEEGEFWLFTKTIN
jgi:hypothetical protein